MRPSAGSAIASLKLALLHCWPQMGSKMTSGSVEEDDALSAASQRIAVSAATDTLRIVLSVSSSGLEKLFQRWGTRPWGAPEEKGPQVSQRAQNHLYLQLLQLLKNSPREVKMAHFRYILVPPPGTTQDVKLMGPGGEGPPRSPPRFLQHWSSCFLRSTQAGPVLPRHLEFSNNSRSSRYWKI